MELPDDAEVIVEATRQRYYRDDAVRWVWIFYGLAQATITMLIAFDVVDTLTPAEIATAVALIVYVGVNEVFVRPYRSKPLPGTRRPEQRALSGPRSREDDTDGTEGPGDV
jgi:hypothetical protein